MTHYIMEIIIAAVTSAIGLAGAATGAYAKYLYNKKYKKKLETKNNIKEFQKIHKKIIDIINNINFSDIINTTFNLSNFIHLINFEINDKYDIYDFLTVYQKEKLFPIFKQIEKLIIHQDYLAFNKISIDDLSLDNYIKFNKEFNNIKDISFPKLDNSQFILSTFDALSDLFKDIKKELLPQKIDKKKVSELDILKNNMENAAIVIQKSFIRYKRKQLKE